MMLSGLLKSDIAVKVNILIIDAFVKMRQYFANNMSNNEVLLNHENRLLKLEKTIIIVSKNIDEILKKKYESQYKNITFINNNSFHDRFIILDRNKLYSCGASFKDLGKKCFAINEFNDEEYLNRLLKTLCL